MVRSIRRVLSILSFAPIYNEDVLHTVLTEIEAIINSRPLFPITLLDVEERPLTLNDLLLPGLTIFLRLKNETLEDNATMGDEAKSGTRLAAAILMLTFFYFFGAHHYFGCNNSTHNRGVLQKK